MTANTTKAVGSRSRSPAGDVGLQEAELAPILDREARPGDLIGRLTACRLCRDAPSGPALPHEPRPIFQLSPTARLLIASQAPGRRAHESGVPFLDPSGVRLRDWLGLDHASFYDASRVAIVPMGFCFPGYDTQGADLPPRRECAPLWRERVLHSLPRLELVLLIGGYSQAWHLEGERATTLTATVAAWERIFAVPRTPRLLPLPHPSWRNSGWLKRHPWFEAELLPVLQAEVRRVLDAGHIDQARN